MSKITAQSVHKAQAKLDDLRADLSNELGRLYDLNYEAQSRGLVVLADPENAPQIKALRKQVEDQAAAVAADQAVVGGKVYRVPSPNLGLLESKLAKIARRAVKLDATPISLTDSGEREYIEWLDRSYTPAKKQIREYLFMVLAGETPRVPGFEFLATVEHHEVGNIVKRIPQIRSDVKFGGLDVESIDLTAYRQGEAVCEHCKLARNRKDTFVVFNQAEGSLVQVGRNCLGDYTGLHNPERVADMAEWLRDFDLGAEGEDDETWAGGRVPEMWLTKEFLAHVAACIRHSGWTPRSYNDGNATADQAIDNLRYYGKTDRKTGAKLYVDVEDEDAERGQAALDWVLAITDTPNDYLHNLLVGCSLEAISRKQAGIVASAISAHDRALERETKRRIEDERKAASANEHIGSEKERLRGLALTVTGHRELERGGYGYNDFDVTHLYSFVDSNGNVLKWFASNSQGIDVGDEILLDGTVKSHGEFRGVNETVLTRCKLVITKEASAA